MKQKRAFITGITGQDGSYLAEFLLAKGYEVFGLLRRTSTSSTERISHILDRITLCPGDLLDASSMRRIIQHIHPDEIYNLAAQSYVGVSWDMPEYTAMNNVLGFIHVLEAVRELNPRIKIYQASSSEMFGQVQETPQKETTPFYPRSPYGISKVACHWMGINYVESYNMFVSSGIMFNHESPRRGEDFVTRKIVKGVAAIYARKIETLKLGYLDAKRDWGFAGDYVEVMWKMLQQEKPGTYVVATGENHTVEEFVDLAFARVGLDKEKHLVVDPTLFRKAEVPVLLGDPTKARLELGWSPKTSFVELVNMMVDAELEKI